MDTNSVYCHRRINSSHNWSAIDKCQKVLIQCLICLLVIVLYSLITFVALTRYIDQVTYVGVIQNKEFEFRSH